MKKDCHYIYYSWDDLGRGYIGVRSCACAPELDTKYFGSFKDKTFQPTSKVIIKTFPTRSDAVRAEIQMHNLFNVGVEPHFANRAKQRSDKFDTSGVGLSEEHRRKLSEKFSGVNNPQFGKTGELSPNFGERNAMFGRSGDKHPRFGGNHTEEAKIKISASKTGERNPMFGKTGDKCPNFGKTGDKSPMFGRAWWVNAAGETLISQECPGPEWQRGRKWKQG